MHASSEITQQLEVLLDGSRAATRLASDMHALLASRSSDGPAEGEQLQQMGLDSLCSSITQVIDQALLLSHALLFNLRWYTASGGGEAFQTCCTSVRGVIKDIASLAHELISAWSDDLQAHNDQNSNLEFQPCKSLASMLVKRLMDLGVTSADAVLSGSDLPNEMSSLASVNVCWGALTRVMTGLPTSQLPLLDASLAVQVIELNLDYLRQWMEHFMTPPHDANKLKVIRFWTMHLTKLVGTYVSCASQCWPMLASTSLCLYHFLARSIQASMEDEEQIRADLEQHLAPKLVQLMMMCVEEEAQDGAGKSSGAGGLEAVMEKVQLLSSELSDNMPQLSDGEGPDSPPRQPVLGRLLLVAAMLHRAPLLSSSAGLLAMARTLLPWVFKATAVEAYPTLGPRCHLADGPMGLVSSGAADLLTAACHFACTHNDATAMEAWRECLAQLYRMALDVHPALQHLASMTLTCFIAAASPEAATQQLVQLGSLVADFAAAEAVAQSGSWAADGRACLDCEASEGVFDVGPSSSASSAACRAVHLMKAALQVAPGSAASAAYQELNLDSSGCDSATSDLAASLATALLLGSFFHARPCSLASEVVPWLMGLVRRTSQLHDVVQGTGQGAEEAAVVASLHLAAVLMAVESSIGQAQQLVQAGSESSDAAGRAVAQAAAAAAEVLHTWALPYTSSCSSLPPRESQTSPPCHVVWALRVVARAGASLPVDALNNLMPALLLLIDQPSCSVHVAAAAAHYSCVEPLPADMFHALLHKGHWALQHEALLSLVSVSRVCTAGDFRALIPKDLFTSSQDAGPAGPQPPQPMVFKLGKAYKAYLERRPGQETVEASALQSWREAEGQALQQLGGSMQQQGAAASLLPQLSSRLEAGLRTLACCASSTVNMAPSSSADPQQPLLTQLVLEGKARLGTAAQAVAALESSLLSLQHAVHSGSAFSGMNPGDARAQLHSHTSYLLAELASTGSKLRSLQEVIHTIR